MSSEEQWKKNLDDAMAVTTGLVLRHADSLAEHQEWLSDHTRAMLAHNRAIAKHDEQMEEIRTALNDLTKRLGGGGNGHGQL